jgi:hypothetical protein
MIAIREFVRSGGNELNDEAVTALIRERMLLAPLFQQKDWLKQVELMLDAYGGQHQVSAADRVREALKALVVEVDDRTLEIVTETAKAS